MKRILTKITELTTMVLVGETEVGSAEVQPIRLRLRAGSARDNQLNATNCRWGGSYTPAIPSYDSQKQFRALKCLKKPDKNISAEGGYIICRRQQKSLNRKGDLSNSR